MASISEKFSGECFDFDFHRLSASSSRGLVLKPKQKEAVSYLLKREDMLAVLLTNTCKYIFIHIMARYKMTSHGCCLQSLIILMNINLRPITWLCLSELNFESHSNLSVIK